jgi:hypothetical protein
MPFAPKQRFMGGAPKEETTEAPVKPTKPKVQAAKQMALAAALRKKPAPGGNTSGPGSVGSA